LISELAQLGISVTARATMMQYQNTAKSILEIARELNVDAVIEGSLFRDGDNLEIAARLYDGDNEQEMWTGSWRRGAPSHESSTARIRSSVLPIGSGRT
jgi:TolB-like protein